MKRDIRIANFSGALGDYFGAFRDCVRGEKVDVIIGDFLAEMTMGKVAEGLISSGRPDGIQGWSAGVFLKQLEPELEIIADRGLKVVVNAGAFNPEGMSSKIQSIIADKNLNLSVAYIRGDNLIPRLTELVDEGQLQNMDTGKALTNKVASIVAANAYLGGWGITEALNAGADIVICGRVTDASLVVGPAAWWHNWKRDDWDQIASACTAGHVIECGPQAMGGNFSGFTSFAPNERLGFPIAEISEDGRALITKRPGDEGIVTVDTVTAQLNYEIQGPCYLNPDVIVHFDTITLTQAGPDKVLISGVKGSPPPTTTKVSCLYHNGYRTVLFAYVTGINWQEKVNWMRRQMDSIAETVELDSYHFDRLGTPESAPPTQAAATVTLRVAAAAKSKSELAKFISGFSSFGLGGMPGFHGEALNGLPPRVEFWPGLINQQDVSHEVVLQSGQIIDVEPSPVHPFSGQKLITKSSTLGSNISEYGATEKRQLGELIHARSGDKGANANLGVWVRQADHLEWLDMFLTEERLRHLLALPDTVTIERYPLHNLGGLNFILNGYFGESRTGNVGLDQIGKAVGEFLRSRIVAVPVHFREIAST